MMEPKEFEDDFRQSSERVDIVFVCISDRQNGKKLDIETFCDAKDINLTDGVFRFFSESNKGDTLITYEEDISDAELHSGLDEEDIIFYTIDKDGFSATINLV